MAQTILVVEDDQQINEVIKEYLKEAGYIVISCDNGRTALNTLNQNKYINMFILDIMLPEINGLELLDAIRKSEHHREKPVIILTALGDEATQLLSFDALADDYIVKPFSPRVLVKRADALVRRSSGETKVLRYEDITVDYDSFEVYDHGEKISLTLREFELLGALIGNAGKVLNRQQLLNRAWGYDYFGDERIVDVHIKNLRKKLNSNVIFTVKGIGYKLGGGA
jgi:two-component system response regulator VanR